MENQDSQGQFISLGICIYYAFLFAFRDLIMNSKNKDIEMVKMKTFVANEYSICSLVELNPKMFPSFNEVKRFF